VFSLFVYVFDPLGPIFLGLWMTRCRDHVLTHGENKEPGTLVHVFVTNREPPPHNHGDAEQHDRLSSPIARDEEPV